MGVIRSAIRSRQKLRTSDTHSLVFRVHYHHWCQGNVSHHWCQGNVRHTSKAYSSTRYYWKYLTKASTSDTHPRLGTNDEKLRVTTDKHNHQPYQEHQPLTPKGNEGKMYFMEYVRKTMFTSGFSATRIFLIFLFVVPKKRRFLRATKAKRLFSGT